MNTLESNINQQNKKICHHFLLWNKEGILLLLRRARITTKQFIKIKVMENKYGIINAVWEMNHFVKKPEIRFSIAKEIAITPIRPCMAFTFATFISFVGRNFAYLDTVPLITGMSTKAA